MNLHEASGTQRLKQFAKDRKLRVKACGVFDPSTMEAYQVQTRLVTDSLIMILFASPSFIFIEVRATNHIMFSVGTPNAGSLRTERMTLPPNMPYPVYGSSDADLRAGAAAWLHDGHHLDLIVALKLTERETIETFTEAITFLFRATRELTDDLIERMATLVRALVRADSRPESISDYSELPLPLRELMQEFGQFAVTDDMRRAELSESLSAADKQRLISTVQPLFPEINRYLDAHQTTASTTPALGALAELAVELLNEQRAAR